MTKELSNMNPNDNDQSDSLSSDGIPSTLSHISAFMDPYEVSPNTQFYREPEKRPTISFIRRNSKIIPGWEVGQLSLNLREMWRVKVINPQNKLFGFFLGVFIPVIINMICVTFFMDIQCVIQDVGWLITFFYFFISYFLSCLTVCSICVIATNGEMQDGGCYYLVSRTLGPEIGTATGITLSLAHATAISWRLHYIALIITYFYKQKTFGKSLRWDMTIFDIISCFIVFFLSLTGIKIVVYILSGLAFILLCGVICLFIGFFTHKPHFLSFFSGIKMSTYFSNFNVKETNVWTSILSLGVLFPTSNAVMTCANFSGVLFDPRKSIPHGAFYAFTIGAFLVIIIILLESGSINFSDKSITNSNIHFLPFEISCFPLLTKIGFISSSIGAALTMSSGGAQIIIRMVNDGLLPDYFNGCTIKNIPIIPHLIILILTLIFAFVGDLNTSTNITNIIFLIPFSLINFAVYISESAHYPGFRPTFSLSNRWLALFCSITCIIRSYLIDWKYSIAAQGSFIIIWFLCRWKNKRHHYDDPWGTVYQSRVYYSTLKEELNLYHIKSHVKTYRPNILFVTTLHPDDRREIIDFIQHLLHGYGMVAVGRIFIKPNPDFNPLFGHISNFDQVEFRSMIEERDGTYLVSSGYKIFYDITISRCAHEGVKDLLLLMGIGMMRPNIFCIEYPEKWITKEEIDFPAEEIVKSLDITFQCYFGAVIIRNAQEFQKVYSNSNTSHPKIDVWWIEDDGGLTVLLPYILSQHKEWKKARLRIFTIVSLEKGETLEEMKEEMVHLLYKIRVFAEVIAVEADFLYDHPSPLIQHKWEEILTEMNLNDDEKKEITISCTKDLLIADLLWQYSSYSSFIFLTMPFPKSEENYKYYMAKLEILSKLNIPFCFVRGTGENTLSWKT